jgi:hypothetical protein
MYVHLNKRSPESGWRDFADLSEFITRFPHRFLAHDGCSTVPFLFLTRDNAHGVSTLDTRYCSLMFAKLHGLYYLNLISEEAGQSRRLAHEGVVGAASRKLTGTSFDLPINAADQADEATMRWAEDQLQAMVVGEFPATYKTGGAEDGMVSAEAPRTTLLASGFVWPSSAQGAAFLAAAKKGREAMDTFLSSDPPSLPVMDGFEYPGGVATFFRECWSLLNATGPTACTKVCEHQFEYKYNPANSLCVPPEPSHAEVIASFEDFLALNTIEGKRTEGWAKGDGYLAQPLPSERRELKYCDLIERLERGGATAIDEWYPKLLLDSLIQQKPVLLTLFTKNHNTLPEEHQGKPLRSALCKLLCMTELALHAELAERVAKDEYKALYESMKARQENDGTLEYVSAIVKRLVGKPVDARHDWPNVPHLKETIKALPGNVKIPSNPKRAVLIQLIALTWRNLPEAQRPRGLVAAAAPAAPAAPLPPAPAPPPRLAEQELLEGGEAPAADAAAVAAATAADDEVAAAIAAAPSPRAEAAVDAEAAEEEEETMWRAEAEVADVLVETAVRLVTVECRRCFGRFSDEAMEYDSTVNHSVCKDKEACTLRMPAGAGGRKRARPEGGYARLARGL